MTIRKIFCKSLLIRLTLVSIIGMFVYAEDVKGLKWCWPTQMEELTQ